MYHLKDLMKEKTVGREDLAKAIGITVDDIITWENNMNTMDAKTIVKIAKYFGVTSDYLLGINEPEYLYVPI